MSKPALGRGLGALLGGVANVTKSVAPTSGPVSTSGSVPAPVAPPAPPGDAVQRVDLLRVRPSPLQPRKEFTAESLQELADSIKEQGIVQPLIVRERDGQFELIAGERRWRAAQLAGLTQVPVIVREASDEAALELALIENLQRENLNPIEESLGYRQLITGFHLTQDQAAAKVGKSRVAVANSLRLLNLPAEVQAWVRDGRLSTGHAKVILSLPGPEQALAGQRALKDGLTVRQTEELVSHWLSRNTGTAATTRPAPASLASRDAHVVSLESKLRERLGAKVALRYRQGKGALEIRFFSDDELERVLDIMGVKVD
ncbi:MAG: ParB/RepB/Spo0J family partition protein [Verrucomicrobia bacterium]|nr:ParB/RepB/Spo0J family partition protein [Verrucomicrobiota bacterium]